MGRLDRVDYSVAVKLNAELVEVGNQLRREIKPDQGIAL